MGSPRLPPPASLPPPNRWPTAAHGSSSSIPGLVRGQSIEGAGRRGRCRRALDFTPRAGGRPAPRHPAPTPYTRPQSNHSYLGQAPRATEGTLGPAAGSARSATLFLRPLRTLADTWPLAHCPSPHTAAHMGLGQQKCTNWGRWGVAGCVCPALAPIRAGNGAQGTPLQPPLKAHAGVKAKAGLVPNLEYFWAQSRAQAGTHRKVVRDLPGNGRQNRPQSPPSHWVQAPRAGQKEAKFRRPPGFKWGRTAQGAGGCELCHNPLWTGGGRSWGGPAAG